MPGTMAKLTWTVLIFLLHSLVVIQAQDFVTCRRNYKKIGCFTEKSTDMDLLINDRDVTSDKHQGIILNWKKLKESLHSLACRCSSQARARGYKFFSIRFWGECYAGKSQLDLDGVVKNNALKSTRCVNHLFKPCNESLLHECVGKAFAEYFYSISEKTVEAVDGGYTEWSEYGECSASCGTGFMARERTCTNPEPKGDGKDCSQLGESTETNSCKVKECPVDGGFSEWSKFSTCDLSCGGGKSIRVRTCTNPSPANGGKPCNGLDTDVKKCQSQECPVDGSWSTWSEYGACTATCGGGVQFRRRSCSDPSPDFGGKDCHGESLEQRDCNMHSCPVDGGYTTWSAFSACSHLCGGGRQSRSRLCTNPVPSNGGKGCSTLGPATETRPCNSHSCPKYVRHNCESLWLDINCARGRIQVEFAMYGRRSTSICSQQANIQNTHCFSASADHKIRAMCEGRTACRVHASNSLFGDPCRGIFKYVEIQYTCQ